MTKQEIITNIKTLLLQTEKVFFHNELKRLNKNDLNNRLETLQSLINTEKEKNDLIKTHQITIQQLLLIAVFGPNSEIEELITIANKDLINLADDFG